jgi:predicted branched-subunit amino acid permease
VAVAAEAGRLTEPRTQAVGPEGAPARSARRSVISAMNWMGGLSLLLFWMPIVGPLVAGLVGGHKAGTVKRAVVAVFLPALLLGLLVTAGVAYLTDLLAWGVLAGLGTAVLLLLQVGPMLAGALTGGLIAELAARRQARPPPGP